MEQNPLLLLQTPEQWPLWPDMDATFPPEYSASHELQANVLQSHETATLEPYRLQPTPNLMVADFPPSTPPDPDAGLDLDFGWCMHPATDGFNIPASYGGLTRDSPHFGSTTGKTMEPPSCFPVLDGALVSEPVPATTQSWSISRKNTRQQFPHMSSFQAHMESPQSHKQQPGAHKGNPRQNIANVAAQSSKSSLPVREGASVPGTSQASAYTKGNWGSTETKRSHSTGLDVPPLSDKTNSPMASPPAVNLSQPTRRAAASGLSREHLPSKKSYITEMRRGQRNDATRSSGSLQKRTRVDRAARLGSKADVTKLSVSVSDYQRHVMNLIELIKKEAV
ncbi:uncharacterized protein LY79DRAFT_564369 [Colletotrichum navitas]|uniref:Uncharacterized protein n=1 Tax=Colletotrichum navitas TaxID=681940 RepID=A0AAD8PRF0_9PEZI|nr:uncharacterized protein LY79DRAFT_564369 [Colletotrichum navitas]KAK1579379.1 hypothetical protein LY79DRAFT_564369 [Colletotrichum navitas]